jgi:hypothetical protein
MALRVMPFLANISAGVYVDLVDLHQTLERPKLVKAYTLSVWRGG